MNEKNLIPFGERTESEQREIARQGGIASGKARREKQQTRQILSELLSIQNKDFAVFQKLAQKLGLQGDLSIHEVFTTICLLNSVKSGSLGDLERLSKLLGEDSRSDEGSFNAGMQTLADLINNPAPNRNIADFEGDNDD